MCDLFDDVNIFVENVVIDIEQTSLRMCQVKDDGLSVAGV